MLNDDQWSVELASWWPYLYCFNPLNRGANFVWASPIILRVESVFGRGIDYMPLHWNKVYFRSRSKLVISNLIYSTALRTQYLPLKGEVSALT